MAERTPSAVSNFDDDSLPMTFAPEDGGGRDDDSLGNESMRVNMNATASDIVSLDDNISVCQFDPGNFSESDIDEDGSINCCPPSFSDVLGGFPESDIEEDEEMSDAGISFVSDIGSPMHSSCRSCSVSEDRDDREDATPLPLLRNDVVTEVNIHPPSSHGDYETYNESETSGAGGREKDAVSKLYPKRLRNSTITKKKLSRIYHHHASHVSSPRRNQKNNKRSERSTKKGIPTGKRRALAVMRVLPDDVMPVIAPFCSIPSCGASTAPKSLSIPILDLCIAEDEGYLGMGEETSGDSDKDENHHPVMSFSDL